MGESKESARVRRRDFLKILGTTGVAGAAVGCSSERVERLIPYLVSPDQTVPGVSTYYATTCRECSAGCGIISETRDGRSIKLEGNPAHPLNRGALCAMGQAALQGLYNPDRFRGPMVRQNGRLQPATWERALQMLVERLGAVRTGGGATSAVFINKHESGSFPAFLDAWLAAFGMPPHLSVDTIAHGAAIAANRQSYGVAWPSLRFDQARLVVSFGADFLDLWGASVPQQLDFADARANVEGAPRFVYIGPRRSLTGLNADEWIPVRPGGELAVAQALLAILGGGTAPASGGGLDQMAREAGIELAAFQRLANALAATRPSLLLAGAATADATDVALAVNQLNRVLGNVGSTIRPELPITSFDGVDSDALLADAVQRMGAGQVQIAMVRGANPAFTLPAPLGFAAAFARVPFKVSFSSYPDETSELCDLILPDHHPLESWGTAQSVPNVVSLQQPAMDPVFDTRATPDVLLQVAGAAGVGAALGGAVDFRTWLIARFPGGAEAFAEGLQRGLAPGNLAPRPPRTGPPTNIRIPAQPLDAAPGDVFFMVYPSAVLGDGSGANKPWLQELPDPVTKIAWQSWIEINPEAAERLDVRPGDLMTLETAAGRVTAPAYVYPGIRQDTVAMMFGRGHRALRDGAEAAPAERSPEQPVYEGYGRYASGVGVNPLAAAPAAYDPRSGAFAWTSTRARIVRTGGHDALVTTEGSARQHGRGIARAVLVTEVGDGREATDTAHAEEQEHHAIPGDASHDFLPGLRAPTASDAEGALASPHGQYLGMYAPDHWSQMNKRRWAMTIDLARCTGCSACVVACYAENNIPTVGAPWQGGGGAGRRPGANILRGREMAWIRLERYYENEEDGAGFETRFVPMLCQHCGNAPCEPVCPVYATYHSPDGLNVQVYNRCVGTRYCSNNCPYKVRYFNWFGFGEPNRPQYAFPEPLNWQLNPDVTVRGKGVMEKCTFCVQRIREAENRARIEGRELSGDEFTVSCAQACPSRAIVFGDAADPAWSVTQLAADRRAYHVFEELNTFTAVVYLKKVNHPAPAVPGRA